MRGCSQLSAFSVYVLVCTLLKRWFVVEYVIEWNCDKRLKPTVYATAEPYLFFSMNEKVLIELLSRQLTKIKRRSVCVRVSVRKNINLDYLIIIQMKDLVELTMCCQAHIHHIQTNERIIKSDFIFREHWGIIYEDNRWNWNDFAWSANGN